MKRILLAGATMLALTAAQPTLAADAPVYKGPAPYAAALFNWSGFYVGGHVGGLWGSVTDLTFGGGDPSPKGWAAGALIGWNWQAPGSSLVFGVEADGGWARTTGSNLVGGGFLQETDVRFTGNVRGRLGLAMDRVLFFLAAGVNFTELSLTHSSLGLGTSTVSGSHTGWTVGGGLDWAATYNLILRLEYLYAGGFPNTTYGFFGGADPHVINLGNLQTVRGAAIWKF